MRPAVDFSLQFRGEDLQRRQQFSQLLILLFLWGFVRAARTAHQGGVSRDPLGRRPAWTRESGHLLAFEGFLHGIGNLLGFGLVGLRGGEHHHEKREQQRDEVRIGDQPAFVVLDVQVFSCRAIVIA